MFDSKMLLVILAIALVIFGTKRLRSIGSDLGGAVKGFKQAVSEEELEATQQLPTTPAAARELQTSNRTSELRG